MKKLEIIKIIKEEIAGVLSEEEARPFTIRYKVEGGEGEEQLKFVATVVDKSGNKEFESFSYPLSSFNAPRQAAYKKVTDMARNYMQAWAKKSPPKGPYVDPQRPGNYDSYKAAEKAFNSEIRPLVIIFSSDNCPECRELESELVGLGLREKLFILNLANPAEKELKDILAPYAPSAAKTVMSYIVKPGGRQSPVYTDKESIVKFLNNKKSELVATGGTQNKKLKKPVKAKVPKKINQPEREDELEEPKTEPEVPVKPKGIIEQVPRGDFLGKSFPVIIEGKKYTVKFENVDAEGSVTNLFSIGVDGQMTLILPNKETRSFKLKDTLFIPSFRYMIRKQDSKEPALRVGLEAAGNKKVNGILDESTIKKLFKEALSINNPGGEKEISMKTEGGNSRTAQLMRRK